MAITDPGSVKLSYLDMVQLEQSGAGLPAHAGKEAALYDGSGAQILGRTAVRHWLDPDPDAAVANSGSPFDETHEFSTLSSVHGWTALGSETVSVSNGVLNVGVVGTDGSYPGAVHTTSLAGDFDIVTTLWTPLVSDLSPYGYVSWSIEDTVNSVSHSMYTIMGDTFRRVYVYDNGSPAVLRAGGAQTQFTSANVTRETLFRFARYSGTFYMAIGDYRWSFDVGISAPASTTGWTIKSVASETRTFDRLRVGFAFASTAGTCLCPFIRRYL